MSLPEDILVFCQQIIRHADVSGAGAAHGVFVIDSLDLKLEYDDGTFRFTSPRVSLTFNDIAIDLSFDYGSYNEIKQEILLLKLSV